MEIQKLLRILSSFSVLIPIAAGLYSFRQARNIHKLFLLFLIYGFTTDMLCWYFFTHEYKAVASFLFNLFSLVEFVFYFYFLNAIGSIPIIRRYSLLFYMIFISAWIYLYIMHENHTVTLKGLYNAAYELLFVAMTVYILLKLVETKSRVSSIPEFWFAIAIFFYCINVFVVFQLVSSAFVQKIWFIQNIVNILTAIILARGFLAIKGQPSGFEAV